MTLDEDISEELMDEMDPELDRMVRDMIQHGNSDHLELDDPDSVANHLDQLINNTQQRAVDGRSPCHVQFLANTFSDKPTATDGCTDAQTEGDLDVCYSSGAKDMCQSFYDSVLCWPATPANTTISLSCPAELQGISYQTEYNATRHCGPNGVWEKANYTGCVPTMSHDADPFQPIPWIHLRIMYCMYWIGYTLSLIFLALALAIFARYRKLWCLRNIIHSNLILCFALHNVTWIAYSFIANEILTRYYGMDEVIYCYVPTILLKYFIAAGFFWMFVEGVYLFISVMFSFHTRRIRFWMCAIVGWVVPLFLILITAIVKSQGDDAEACWNEQYHLDYIFIGPVLSILLVNVVFLLIIMYVVVTKLQVTVPVEATRYKKAIKALFILCPLLGVNYVFVLVQPTNPVWAKLIFSYYFTITTSFQGFLVALLFCFRNNEVIAVLEQNYKEIVERMQRRWTRKHSDYAKLLGSTSRV